MSHTSHDLLDLSAVRSPQVRALVLLAMMLDGWIVRIDGGVRFDHHETGQHMVLPTTTGNLRDGVMASHVRKLVRYGTPTGGRAMAEEIADTCKLDRNHKRRFVEALRQDWPVEEQPAPEPAPVERPKHKRRTPPTERPRGTRPRKQPAAAAPAPAPEPEPTPAPAPAERTLVSEQPARAVRYTRPDGGAGTYESQTTNERRWSDGTVDYACRWPDCDWSGPSLRSVSNHYRVHERGVEIPDVDGVTFDHVATRRVTRLAREIEAAMEATDSTDPTKLAEWIVGQRVESGDTHDAEPSEMTPEQVLDRIARLVDRGETPRLRDQITQLAADLAAVNEQLTKNLAAMARLHAERDEARGALQALRDLIPQYDTDTEEEEA